MSYNYSEHISTIHCHRENAYSSSNNETKLTHYQNSIDAFHKLSSKTKPSCPMTPLLWMQLTNDTECVTSLLRILGLEDNTNGNSGHKNSSSSSSHNNTWTKACDELKLGLDEFPCCALLRLYYLDILICKHGESDVMDEEGGWKSVQNFFYETIAKIGHGSHLGEENVVVAFYNVFAYHVANQIKSLCNEAKYSKEKVEVLKKDLLNCFWQRAKTPMMSRTGNWGNDAIRTEMEELSAEYGINFSAQDYEILEGNRQFASKYVTVMKGFADDILASMAQEGMEPCPDLKTINISLRKPGELAFDWDNLLRPGQQYLMGLGMTETASSFVKFSQGIISQRKYMQKQLLAPDTDHNEEMEDVSKADYTSLEKEFIESMSSMLLAIFERGISECPTVEYIWERYIQHLLFVLNKTEADDALKLSTLQTLSMVCSRSVRNCPYSLKLWICKMKCILEHVKGGRKVFDPDDFLAIAIEAVTGKFLPDAESCLEIYLEAFRLVKQKIMSFVSKATSQLNFDEAEQLEKGKRREANNESEHISVSKMIEYSKPLDEETEDDVDDFIDDLRKICDAADTFLRKNHRNWTLGRARLYMERANVEAYLCSPLVGISTLADEAIKCYEKLVRVHQPPSPYAWLSYIQYLMGKKFGSSQNIQNGSEAPGLVIAKLRYVRNIYHRAMISVKKQKKEDMGQENAEFLLALQKLCYSYLEFERIFGSQESLIAAKKQVNGKLVSFDSDERKTLVTEEELPVIHVANIVEKINTESDNTSAGNENNTKRRLNESSIEYPDTKRVKYNAEDPMEHHDDNKDGIESTTDQDFVSEQKKINLKVIKKLPKIWIGKLQYPAHPFTIHVKDLSPDTSDMDLYELLHDKCGAIVHTRIFREKYDIGVQGHIPKSKCSGLVQFEERESVEKALELSGEMGLHEKLITIERSHQPAVSIVPPGMHRIRPKGQGKKTKQNMKRKNRRLATNKKKTAPAEGETKLEASSQDSKMIAAVPQENLVTSSGKANVLSFRPRNVGRKKLHKKR